MLGGGAGRFGPEPRGCHLCRAGFAGRGTVVASSPSATRSSPLSTRDGVSGRRSIPERLPAHLPEPGHGGPQLGVTAEAREARPVGEALADEVEMLLDGL